MLIKPEYQEIGLQVIQQKEWKVEPRQQAELQRRVVQGLGNILCLGLRVLLVVVPIGIIIKKRKLLIEDQLEGPPEQHWRA